MDILRAPLPARTLSALAVLALMFSLSGCQIVQRPTGEPIVIKRDGSNISVVLCADREAAAISMQEREYPGAWKTFWEFEKQISLRKGDDISPYRADDFGVEQGSDPQLTPNHEIGVFIDVQNQAEQSDVRATFSIGPDGLSDEAWLHDDGTVSALPCK